MILLLGLLCSFWVEPVLGLEEDGFVFNGELRNFAVGTNSVYIATEEKLYQLSHDLKLVRSLNQRGFLKDADSPGEKKFVRVSESAAWSTTFRVNVLLPFTENKTLISCGMTDSSCGYCEVLDLNNISNLLYSEHIEVGPQRSSNASVSFLVDVKKDSSQTQTYILTAIQQHGENAKSECGSDSETINLHNVDNTQSGGIFSVNDGSGTHVIRTEDKAGVEFVDGFQVSSSVYLLSNVRSGQNNRVRLIWFESKTSKSQTFRSLRGATLRVSDGGCRLLASSIIPGGQQVLWSGVFSVDGEQSNTELVVFDISPDRSSASYTDPDFYTTVDKPKGTSEPKILEPTAVLFKQNHMTSVLAVRQRSWMVFFIGTGDGQLIKLAVDRNFHPACPRVLYRANTDRQVFPNICLDPVDHRHVYVPFRNQMKRETVSNCSSYTNVQDCCSAQDPYCVWCASQRSCTFESDCTDSDWLSIPDESQQKLVSHKLERDPSGQIRLIVQTHLTGSQRALSNFTCLFSASSETLNPISSHPTFPNCTNILTNESLPADGLIVTVKMRLGGTILKEQLNVINCSDIHGPLSSVMCQKCIQAGCGWSNNACSWANEGLQDVSVCQQMEAGRNFSRPEISSIQPSAVSFYGRNHALLSGRNLCNVTGVRIQTDMDCSPRESPVWNNNGATLTFHIPSTHLKGSVKVCALLPDGSCHGNAKITYQSLPVCFSVMPSSTWTSGKRTITLTGSHMEFVEQVVHSHALQDLRPPRAISYENLIYETPAAGNTGIFFSAVSLKVASQKLACCNITYYPDPEFTSFTSVKLEGNDVQVTIQKKKDKLEMTTAELSVWGVEDEKLYPCINIDKITRNETEFYVCKIEADIEFQHLMIKYGDKTVTLGPPSLLHQVILILRLMLAPCVIAVLVFICWWHKR